MEIDADGAVVGGYARVRIDIPNERETATVRVVIELPTDVDIPHVWVRSPAGWRASIARRTLRVPIRSEQGDISEVVSAVTFEGGTIDPGEFETFYLRLGPLSVDAGAVLTFPTLQVFADGSSERWADPVEAGEPEPDLPVPTVVVRANEAGVEEVSDGTSEDALHLWLGISGAALGAAGLALGAVAFVRSRKR